VIIDTLPAVDIAEPLVVDIDEARGAWTSTRPGHRRGPGAPGHRRGLDIDEALTAP